MADLYDIAQASPTLVPGTKAEARRPGEQPIEDSERKKRYRTAVGKALLYAHKRPDAQFATKEYVRTVGNPTEEDEKRMRKLIRYYFGTRTMKLYLEPFETGKGYQMATFVDSDWAGDRVTRKSTTETGIKLNRALVLPFARAQQTPAHSAAEAELNVLISGAFESIGIKTMLEELGRKVSV